MTKDFYEMISLSAHGMAVVRVHFFASCLPKKMIRKTSGSFQKLNLPNVTRAANFFATGMDWWFKLQKHYEISEFSDFLVRIPRNIFSAVIRSDLL